MRALLPVKQYTDTELDHLVRDVRPAYVRLAQKNLAAAGTLRVLPRDGYPVPKLTRTDTQARSRESAEVLRPELTAQLREQGTIGNAEVAAHFRCCAPAPFVPGEPLKRAYPNDSVITKRDGDRMALSSVSAPWLQAPTSPLSP